MTYTEVQAVMRIEGFVLNGCYNEIDAHICDTDYCSRCCFYPLRYVPYYNEKDNVYRAFAMCPECGLTEEF